MGMSRPEIAGFTMTRTEEGTKILLRGGGGDEDDEFETLEEVALLEQARKILEEYDVGSWNGFSGTNSMVLDGGTFSINVDFLNGSSLSASGCNRYPENYQAVSSELRELIEPARKKWRNERYPKTITDTELDEFSFKVRPTFGNAEFDCSFNKRPDDPEHIYLRAKIKNGYGPKHPECIDYSFYGSVPEPPFEALQKVIKQENIAAWNGYEEILPSEEQEKSFYLIAGYQSRESITAYGSLLPENYEAAETEIIRIIWEYIQKRQDEFTEWK